MNVKRLCRPSAAMLIGLVAVAARAQGPNPKLDPPVLSCKAVSQTSITLMVCAGNTGAQAGFSIQWKTAADFAANGWSSDAGDSYCGASFSGVPSNSHGSRLPCNATLSPTLRLASARSMRQSMLKTLAPDSTIFSRMWLHPLI